MSAVVGDIVEVMIFLQFLVDSLFLALIDILLHYITPCSAVSIGLKVNKQLAEKGVMIVTM